MESNYCFRHGMTLAREARLPGLCRNVVKYLQHIHSVVLKVEVGNPGLDSMERCSKRVLKRDGTFPETMAILLCKFFSIEPEGEGLEILFNDSIAEGAENVADWRRIIKKFGEGSRGTWDDDGRRAGEVPSIADPDWSREVSKW